MASKSKKRRRVLGASCILAALIIAGSSFAWFTSKDEVTNRLSASANYGVTIAENFTPPENWVPGQEIDKDVAVVNTGNVDAFVRTWLEGEMDLLAQKRDVQTWDGTQFTDGATSAKTVLPTTASYTKSTVDGETDAGMDLLKTSDENLKALGMTYSFEDNTSPTKEKYYLKELDTTIYQNPNSPTSSKENPDYFNDVMSVQAGGVLAYLKTGATATAGDTVFYYKPNQGMTIKTDTAAGESGTTYPLSGNTEYQVKIDKTGDTKVPAGDTIFVDNTTHIIYVNDEAAIIKYLGNYIDSDNFYPAATGLYIFRRNADKVDDSNDPTRSDYEFSGYYYVKSGSEVGIQAATASPAKTSAEITFANQGKYFALQYVKGEDDDTRSDYVLEKDTYTVARTTAGDVTFYPARAKTGTYNSGANTAYSPDGTTWYDSETGFVVTGVTADSTPAKSVTLFTAQQKVINNANLKWNYLEKETKYTPYKNDTTNAMVYVVDPSGTPKIYDSVKDIMTGGSVSSTVTSVSSGYTAQPEVTINSTPWLVASKDNVLIDIALADNLTATNENDKWKLLSGTAGDSKYTFYYTNDVEEGCTTARLVDSVTLDQSVTQDDYIAFDFDLNVKMDSVQVTLDNAGNETTDAAASEFATGDAPVKITSVTDGDTSSEAGSLTWANA